MTPGILLAVLIASAPGAQRVQAEADAVARRVSIQLQKAQLEGLSKTDARARAVAREPGGVRLVDTVRRGVTVTEADGTGWLTAFAPVPGAVPPLSVALTARRDASPGPSPWQASFMILAAAAVAFAVGRRSARDTLAIVQCDVEELVQQAARRARTGPMLQVIPGRTDPVLCQPERVGRVLGLMLDDAAQAAGPDGRVTLRTTQGGGEVVVRLHAQRTDTDSYALQREIRMPCAEIERRSTSKLAA